MRYTGIYTEFLDFSFEVSGISSQVFKSYYLNYKQRESTSKLKIELDRVQYIISLYILYYTVYMCTHATYK